MKKLTNKEKLVKQAVMRGVRNIGKLKIELNLNEAPLMLALNRAKRAGMFNYEFYGRKVIFHPTKKGIALAMSL